MQRQFHHSGSSAASPTMSVPFYAPTPLSSSRATATRRRSTSTTSSGETARQRRPRRPPPPPPPLLPLPPPPRPHPPSLPRRITTVPTITRRSPAPLFFSFFIGEKCLGPLRLLHHQHHADAAVAQLLVHESDRALSLPHAHLRTHAHPPRGSVTPPIDMQLS